MYYVDSSGSSIRSRSKGLAKSVSKALGRKSSTAGLSSRPDH